MAATPCPPPTLEAGGIALEAARAAVSFRLSADADQFLTMAKFRALRLLWARVEQACGLAPKPVFIAAETAWRMLTQRDPYVNMRFVRSGRSRPAARIAIRASSSICVVWPAAQFTASVTP